MANNKLTITIEGAPGAGKSRVARGIADLLFTMGALVRFYEGDELAHESVGRIKNLPFPVDVFRGYVIEIRTRQG